MKIINEHLLKEVEHLYTTNIETFGKNSKAVGWNTDSCHLLRFQKLCQELPRGKAISITDLGCGYGALYEFAVKNDIKIEKYYGYDISKKMLNECKTNLQSFENIFLINSSMLQYKTDYVIASGIFNNIGDADKREWVKYILNTLDNMNDSSTAGFSFNLLTNQVDYMRSDLFYADPAFYFNLCREKYSRNVSLYHNYDLWEWTIIVTK